MFGRGFRRNFYQVHNDKLVQACNSFIYDAEPGGMPDTRFIDALHATKPACTLRLGLYAFLVGSWRFDATVTTPDGNAMRETGSIYAGWVLGGHALQDVWILPGIFHGSTLRVYDGKLDAWRIGWSDPTRPYFARQLGRACGPDIVQLGDDSDGRTTRWRFVERTPDAFRWLGEYLSSDDGEWRLEADFRAQRVTS